MNPFDEIAVEEAVRLKEAGVATEIVAVSIGTQQCQETLRTALAIGADRAILVETDAELQPLAVAKAAEGDGRQGEPEARSSWASRRSTTIPTRPARCSPRCSAGRRRRSPRRSRSTATRPRSRAKSTAAWRTIAIKLPAVVTTDLRLNEPRYVTLPNIMKAKKKPLEMIKPEALGVDVAPRLTTLKVEEPPKRRRRRQGRRRRRSWSRSSGTKPRSFA